MMIIKRPQIEQFNTYMVDVFMNKTVAYIKDNFSDWVGEKEDAELKNYIDSMVNLGKKYKIHKEISIQKLIRYHMLYQFAVPLHKKLEGCLTRYQLSENRRIELFFLTVASGRYNLIEINLHNN